jgi:hypothetical protein
MNKRYFAFLYFILNFSCKNTENEKIIFTCGLSENPNSPRIGLEINSKNIFYCEEIINQKGTYSYFQAENNKISFLELKQSIIEKFNEVNQRIDITDDTKYELIYHFENLSDTLIFQRFNLTEKQNLVIDKIINLQNIKFSQILKHEFPQKLLQETLPLPPPEPKRN